MLFEAPKQTAERLGVTVRAIQKWAKQGRIPGAYFDRSWRIPTDFTAPLATADVPASFAQKHILLPLLSSTYPVGRAKDFIDGIEDEDDRNCALVEYYYYKGDTARAVEIAQQYINSEDEILRYNSGVMCTFCNVFEGHIHLAAFFYELVLSEIKEAIARENSTEESRAITVVIAKVGKILLNGDIPEVPLLEEYLYLLPDGIRLYAAYMLAYKAFKDKNYEKAIGICEASLAIFKKQYPIATVYTLIILSASYMATRKTDEAKNAYMQAWEIAKADGFIKLFGIHHRLLQGLTDLCLKNDCPDDYKAIMQSAKEFNEVWNKQRKTDDLRLTGALTPIELTVAILYNGGYVVKEIAAHLDISERTVKRHIRDIYDTLGVTNKQELQVYLEN